MFYFNDTFEKENKNLSSPAGNRTPVSRVTGGDTHHYTTEDVYMSTTTQINYG